MEHLHDLFLFRWKFSGSIKKVGSIILKKMPIDPTFHDRSHTNQFSNSCWRFLHFNISHSTQYSHQFFSDISIRFTSKLFNHREKNETITKNSSSTTYFFVVDRAEIFFCFRSHVRDLTFSKDLLPWAACYGSILLHYKVTMY